MFTVKWREERGREIFVFLLVSCIYCGYFELFGGKVVL